MIPKSKVLIALMALNLLLASANVFAAESCECVIMGPGGVNVTLCSASCTEGEAACCGCGLLSSKCLCCAVGKSCESGQILGVGKAKCV